jgi:hypothetical protein
VSKIPHRNNLKEKGSLWLTVSEIAVHGPWSVDSRPGVTQKIWRWGVMWRNHFTSWRTGSRESNREGLEPRHSSQGHTPCDLLPPVRPHLLESAPPAWNWTLNRSRWGTLCIHPVTGLNLGTLLPQPPECWNDECHHTQPICFTFKESDELFSNVALSHVFVTSPVT